MTSTKCLNKSSLLTSSSMSSSPSSSPTQMTTTQPPTISATSVLLCSASSPTASCQSSSAQSLMSNKINEFQHGTLQNDLNEIAYAVALMIVEGRHVNSDSNESWDVDSQKGFMKKAAKYYVKEGEHASFMVKTLLNKINQLNSQSMVGESRKILLNQSDEFIEDEHICNLDSKVSFFSISIESKINFEM